MSWYDSVGDAWNAVKDVGGKIGQAWNGYEDWKAKYEAAPADNPLTAFNRAANAKVIQPLQGPVAAAGSALATGVNDVNRGIATGLIATSDAGPPGSIFDPQTYKKAWGLTDVNIDPTTGVANEGISMGQAIGTRLGAPTDFSMDPASVKARQDFFHNSWQGQISSGGLDLLQNLFLDPTVLLGKVGKVARLASTEVKAGEQASVLLAAEGAKTGARRVDKLGGKVDSFLNWTDGKTPAEIMTHPVMNNVPEGGAISTLFAQANTITDEVARREAKKDLFGAMIGDAQSITNLREKQALLGNSLQRLTDTPIETKYTRSFTFADFGEKALADANATLPPEITQQADKIQAELSRLDRVLENTGATGRIAGDPGSMQVAEDAIQGLRTSELHSGFGSRAITVIGGKLGNHLEGHINIEDAAQGYTQLNDYLKQARYLTGTDRRALLDQFLTSTGKGDRQGAVRAAESAVIKSTGAKYGLSPEQIQTLSTLGDGRRSATLAALKTRVYSAADDGLVTMTDPDTGQIIARTKPNALSQIESFHNVVDPAALDRAMRAGAQQRMFERMGAVVGDGTRDLATGLYRPLDALGDMTHTALQGFTRVWKDTMLIPRAIPYVMRSQIDSQMRLKAHMGTLHYLTDAFPEAVKGQGIFAKNFLKDLPIGPAAKGDARSYSQRIAEHIDKTMDDAIRPGLQKMFKDTPLGEGEIDGIIRAIKQDGNGALSIGDHVSRAVLNNMRATGDFRIVQPGEPTWAGDYLNAVNKQIRNSPIQMKALEGASTRDLKDFLLKDPAGREEWQQLKGTWDGDIDGYVAQVQAHVNHMLPSADMRSTALTRQLSAGDMGKWFKDPANQMQIHGQAYVQTEKNVWKDWYTNGRNNVYKMISDAPENVLARQPLYMYEYSNNLRGIVSRLEASSGGKIAVDSPEMLNARMTAHKQALKSLGDIMFNSSHTSNLAHSMKFISPFFGAWEDTMKKWSSLFYENPGELERFRQVFNAPAAAGLTVDENGNRVDSAGNHIDQATGRVLDPVKDARLIGSKTLMVIPQKAIPKFVRDATGINQLSFDPKSFNSIFQGDPWWLPGFGPLVQVPANEVVKRAFLKEANDPIMKYLLPYGTNDDPVPMQLLPAWAKNIIKSGATPLGDSSDLLKTASLYYKEETVKFQLGERKTAPTLDEVTNMARNAYLLRAAIGLSPAGVVPMQPSAEMQFYIDQGRAYRDKYGSPQDTQAYKDLLHQYQKQYPDTAKDHLLTDHPEMESWDTKFRRDFPEYYDLAVSTSANATGIVATTDAVEASKKYAKEISQNPQYGWMFVGPDNAYGLTQGTSFSNAAYNAQFGQQFGAGGTRGREALSPQAALNAAEVNRGWTDYQRARIKLNLAMEQQGFTSLNQKGAEGLAAAWKQFVQVQMVKDNPTWFKAYNQRDTGKVTDLLSAAKQATDSNKSLAQRPDMVALMQYARGREKLQAALAKTGKTLGAKGNEALQAAWLNFTQQLVQSSPGFEQIYSRVLEADNFNGVVVTGNA